MLYSLAFLATICAVDDARFWEQLVQNCVKNLESADASDRLRAAHTLGGLGDTARVAVPALVKTVLHDRDSEVREEAAHALGGVGRGERRAVQALVVALRDPEQNVRLRAACSLARQGDARGMPVLAATLLGWRPGPYLPILGRASALVFGPLLNGTVELNVGSELHYCLWRLHVEWDDNAWQRKRAAEALGELGPKARGATPMLRSALHDPHWCAREAAAKALEQVMKKGS
jgi:HEAT repeat protein